MTFHGGLEMMTRTILEMMPRKILEMMPRNGDKEDSLYESHFKEADIFNVILVQCRLISMLFDHFHVRISIWFFPAYE